MLNDNKNMSVMNKSKRMHQWVITSGNKGCKKRKFTKERLYL